MTPALNPLFHLSKKKNPAVSVAHSQASRAVVEKSNVIYEHAGVAVGRIVG
jgi:hypothetical protein